ncbi:hypothetical protein [Quadrisphaera sp. DSM 44207]|uniref:FitA-like ribbon-helix-helix domain-containing protein n=1 Tax=Quadrisphaera sp. DSM 44207 TaxID=1881057 RepID=UPI000B8847A7|nr:hypothetical protein [Quadrisphaera sp. DSM 44207]
MDLNVRDVPPDVHALLRERAAAAGQSLRAHVIEVLTQSVRRPSVAEWRAQLADLPPVRSSLDSAELVRLGRRDGDPDSPPDGDPSSGPTGG